MQSRRGAASDRRRGDPTARGLVEGARDASNTRLIGALPYRRAPVVWR
jgi:hypothetical protein